MQIKVNTHTHNQVTDEILCSKIRLMNDDGDDDEKKGCLLEHQFRRYLFQSKRAEHRSHGV